MPATTDRASLALAQAKIDRRFNGVPTQPHRYVFPPSPRFSLLDSHAFGSDIRAAEADHGPIGYDRQDGLYKFSDGTVLPRINSAMVILAAVRARQAETVARAEAALSRADPKCVVREMLAASIAELVGASPEKVSA